MIFLIEYDRQKELVIQLKIFRDLQRSEAENLRLQLELELNRKGLAHEVVLLEAQSEEALRRTHRRYFENLNQINQSIRDATQGSSQPWAT